MLDNVLGRVYILGHKVRSSRVRRGEEFDRADGELPGFSGGGPSTTIWLPRMTYPWPQTALPHRTQRASAVLSLPFMLPHLFRIWEPLTKFPWASIRHRDQAGSAVAAPFALDRDPAYVEPRRH